MTQSPTNIRQFYKTGEVGGFLGLSHHSVQQLFNQGILWGHRTLRAGDRRISRNSLLQYAMKNKIHIPEIGMDPYSVVMLGVDRQVQYAIIRAAAKTKAMVHMADTEAEFGLMLSGGDKCCAVVDTSIGTINAINLAKTIRRHNVTKTMLLIAIAAEDSVPTRVAQAGYDHVYRSPFNVSALVRRVAMAARKFQERIKGEQ